MSPRELLLRTETDKPVWEPGDVVRLKLPGDEEFTEFRVKGFKQDEDGSWLYDTE